MALELSPTREEPVDLDFLGCTSGVVVVCALFLPFCGEATAATMSTTFESSFAPRFTAGDPVAAGTSGLWDVG